MALHLSLRSTGSLTASALDTYASQPTTPMQTGLSNASIAQFGSLLSRHAKETLQSGPPSPLTHFGQTARRLANRLATPLSTWPTASNPFSHSISPSPPSLSQIFPPHSPPPTSLPSVHANSKNAKSTSLLFTPTS